MATPHNASWRLHPQMGGSAAKSFSGRASRSVGFCIGLSIPAYFCHKLRGTLPVFCHKIRGTLPRPNGWILTPPPTPPLQGTTLSTHLTEKIRPQKPRRGDRIQAGVEQSETPAQWVAHQNPEGVTEYKQGCNPCQNPLTLNTLPNAGVIPLPVFRRPFGAVIPHPVRRGFTPACVLPPLRGLIVRFTSARCVQRVVEGRGAAAALSDARNPVGTPLPSAEGTP